MNFKVNQVVKVNTTTLRIVKILDMNETHGLYKCYYIINEFFAHLVGQITYQSPSKLIPLTDDEKIKYL